MRYIKASLLLVGFLLVQSTTAMAQCPIKEQIMNGDDEGEGLEKERRETIADFRKVKGVVSVNKDGIMQLQ